MSLWLIRLLQWAWLRFMEEKHPSSDCAEGRETLHVTFSTAYLVYDIGIASFSFQATT